MLYPKEKKSCSTVLPTTRETPTAQAQSGRLTSLTWHRQQEERAAPITCSSQVWEQEGRSLPSNRHTTPHHPIHLFYRRDTRGSVTPTSTPTPHLSLGKNKSIIKRCQISHLHHLHHLTPSPTATYIVGTLCFWVHMQWCLTLHKRRNSTKEHIVSWTREFQIFL